MNNANGTLTIEKVTPCKAEIRKEMYYIIEEMNELETKVRVGREAERSLKVLEERFKDLCEEIVEEGM